jgi:hypothetical protein
MVGVDVYRGNGSFQPLPLPDLLDQLDRCRANVVAPFSPERIAIITELSARLLADRRIVERPALAYFAHWTRRSAIRDLASRFQATMASDTLAAPRGVVFHIPPKNVETIFLFSWISSYLVGNANIVRLPSGCAAPIMCAVDVLVELTSSRRTSELFICYPAQASVNEAVSRSSDVRIVWGGDEKIRAFESLPLRNGGKSLWFGDRYSYAVIFGDALPSAGTSEQTTLAKSLATDIFTFDQMGCSSPHKIYVVGNPEDHGPGIVSLVEAVRSEAHRRGVQIPASHAIRKFTEALVLAGTERGTSIPSRSAELISVVVPHLRRAEDRVGGGFIVIEFISKMADLLEVVRPSDQTLSHYGFGKADLVDFAKVATLTGISRIVPIGQALSFDSVWDGYDLLRELTRTIRVASGSSSM